MEWKYREFAEAAFSYQFFQFPLIHKAYMVRILKSRITYYLIAKLAIRLSLSGVTARKTPPHFRTLKTSDINRSGFSKCSKVWIAMIPLREQSLNGNVSASALILSTFY